MNALKMTERDEKGIDMYREKLRNDAEGWLRLSKDDKSFPPHTHEKV